MAQARWLNCRHTGRQALGCVAPIPAKGCTVVLLMPLLAWATDDPPLELRNVQGPTVEVVGHYLKGIGSSDAASQGAVSASLIQDRPTLRAGEVLEFVPGMIVTQHSGSGKANQYFLRGFNLDHGTDFAVNVDGMPVNMRTHGHGQGYADVNFIIPELVNRIDYTKGPYFAEQGDFSSAGSAHFRLFNRLDQSLGSVSLGTDNYLRALWASSPEVADGNLLYAAEWTGYDGPWVNPENLRKINGAVRYSQTEGDTTVSFTGMFYQAEWDATDQIPQRALAAGTLGRFDTVDSSDGGATRRYSVSGNAQTRLGEGQLKVDAYFIDYELDLWSNFTYFLDDPVDGDQFQQVDRRVLHGGSAHYDFPLSLGALTTNNRIGFQLRRDTIDEVALNHTKARQYLATTRSDSVTQQSFGWHFDNTVQWTDWIRTVIGVRGDHYRFSVRSNRSENSGVLSDDIISPKFTAVLGPWSKSEFFLNYGRGFHSNDARGTVISVDPVSLTPAQRVTPLVPTQGAELGARSEVAPGVQTSLALWRLDVDSELVFIGDAGNTDASRPSRRQGIEWITNWRPLPGLLVDLDVDFSRSKFRDSDAAGQHIPGSVERAIQAGLYVNNFGPWSGALVLRHFGPRPLVEDNSVRSASTTMTNLRLGYQAGKVWNLHLDVLNLFDREHSDIEYYYESRLAGEAGGVEDIHVHPVESRQIRLTLSAQF